MNIDWITVIIQAVNFLILVWILKRYLYRPVLNAMDAREKAVFKKLRDAESREKEADKAQKNLEKEKARVKEKSRQIFLDAHKEADAEKSEMVKEAHADIQKKQDRFEEQLDIEKKALYQSVRELAGTTLVQTARDALDELANQKLEEEMAALFVEKLNAAKGKDIDYIVNAIQAGKEVYLSSSQDLDAASKKAIEAGLKKLTGKAAKVSYKTNKDLICGVELLCDTAMIRWGFDKYIENFGRALNDTLNKITA